MKVLTICDVLFPHTVGGAGRVAREVANALKRLGVEIEFLTRRVESAFAEETPTEYLPPLWQAPLGMFRKTLDRQMRRFKPDIIHAHQPLPAYLTISSASSVPMVYTFHSSWPEEWKIKSSRWPAAFRSPLGGVYRSIERSVIHSARAVTVLSEFSRKQVKLFYGTDVSIIPGGVDTTRFHPIEVPRSNTGVRLITVRNLVPRMGLDSLIRAMTLLPSRIHLDIAGEGPLRHDLEGLIAQLRLTSRVRMAGHVPDAELPQFYSSGDWFVLPTAALEGFGLVTLESLACGTPVLGTRIGAIPEVLERFDRGWVIESSTPESIASTVRFAIETHPPNRATLHDRVAEEFDWDKIAEKFATLFQSSLKTSSH